VRHTRRVNEENSATEVMTSVPHSRRRGDAAMTQRIFTQLSKHDGGEYGRADFLTREFREAYTQGGLGMRQSRRPYPNIVTAHHQ
jgi:hypothetical protein